MALHCAVSSARAGLSWNSQAPPPWRVRTAATIRLTARHQGTRGFRPAHKSADPPPPPRRRRGIPAARTKREPCLSRDDRNRRDRGRQDARGLRPSGLIVRPRHQRRRVGARKRRRGTSCSGSRPAVAGSNPRAPQKPGLACRRSLLRGGRALVQAAPRRNPAATALQREDDLIGPRVVITSEALRAWRAAWA